MVIGITGGIATGKSAFLECLRDVSRGTFFDADRVAHELHRDPEVRALVEQEFGPEAYLPSGDLNRQAIRAIIFSDAAKKRALEQILHPRIRRQWSIEAETRRGSRQLFFADIPLLYETRGEILCDRVVVVACSADVQLERLVKRMSISKLTAEQMIGSQMPLADKIGRADHVVWNNGPRAVLADQARMLAQLWES